MTDSDDATPIPPELESRSESLLRITRVYTKIGDQGMTRLVGNREAAKDHPRVETYGDVDELSVAVGRARRDLSDALNGVTEPGLGAGLAALGDQLAYLQNQLFTVGGDLATRFEDRWPGMPLVAASDTEYLEKLIDAYNDELPPLKDFALPFGAPATIALHECRVVCRRAERRLRSLSAIEETGPYVTPYLNRLSDLFFVLARWTDRELRRLGLVAEPETIWKRDWPAPEPKVGGR